MHERSGVRVPAATGRKSGQSGSLKRRFGVAMSMQDGASWPGVAVIPQAAAGSAAPGRLPSRLFDRLSERDG